MRRPAPRGGLPNAPASSISRPSWRGPRRRRPPRQELEDAEAELKAAAAAEVRRARNLAQCAARGGRRARAPCRRPNARSTATPRAIPRSPKPAAASPPTAARPTPRMRPHRLAGRPAAEPGDRDAARHGARARSPATARSSAGSRRSAGAGARGRTRRPPPAVDRGRAQRVAGPQGQRRLADRHHRGARQRSHGPSAPSSTKRRRCSPRSAAR